MSGFSFSFAGDDIEIDSSPDALPSVSNQAAETGTLAPRKSSGAFPVAGQPLLPPIYHTLEEFLKTLPSQIAYSTLVVKLDDGKEIDIPRRELWDVRAQLMAEDEGNGEGLLGLGNDDVKTGVYEGGFKSWESSVDLVKVLSGRTIVGEGRRRVLEVCVILIETSITFKSPRAIMLINLIAWLWNCSSISSSLPMVFGKHNLFHIRAGSWTCRLQSYSITARHFTQYSPFLGTNHKIRVLGGRRRTRYRRGTHL